MKAVKTYAIATASGQMAFLSTGDAWVLAPNVFIRLFTSERAAQQFINVNRTTSAALQQGAAIVLPYQQREAAPDNGTRTIILSKAQLALIITALDASPELVAQALQGQDDGSLERLNLELFVETLRTIQAERQTDHKMIYGACL